VRPLASGWSTALTRTAIRHLGTIGAAAQPALQTFIGSDRRPPEVNDRGPLAWQPDLATIGADEELLHLARTAVAQLAARP
jgi:hypothetical protein